MEKHSEKLARLNKNLRNQHKDLNVDNTYNFLRVSEMLNDYLTIGFNRKNGLNRTQIMILHFLLASGGSTTPTKMKRLIFRSMNAISKSMDSLDEMGLTKSIRPKTDRRERQVILTDEGLEMMKQILPIRKNLFTWATNCLSQCEAEAFGSLLSQMENYLLNITKDSFKSMQKKLYF